MAKFHERKEKRGPVPHKVFSDRGVHLEKAHQAQQGSNLNYGRSVIVDQDESGKDIIVKIGQKCPKCKKRVRGLNHASGDHHNGTASKRPYR